MAESTEAEFADLLNAWGGDDCRQRRGCDRRFMAPEWVIVGQTGITTREQFLAGSGPAR
jgi:hypothetical protein